MIRIFETNSKVYDYPNSYEYRGYIIYNNNNIFNGDDDWKIDKFNIKFPTKKEAEEFIDDSLDEEILTLGKLKKDYPDNKFTISFIQCDEDNFDKIYVGKRGLCNLRDNNLLVFWNRVGAKEFINSIKSGYQEPYEKIKNRGYAVNTTTYEYGYINYDPT